MQHICPECHGEDIEIDEYNGIIFYRCRNCGNLWGDMKPEAYHEEKPKIVSDEPNKPSEPEP